MALHIRQRISTFLQKVEARFKAKQPTDSLLPIRQPPLASFRPGRQHCQIHDAEYLQQILLAEMESPSQPDQDASQKERSAHDG